MIWIILCTTIYPFSFGEVCVSRSSPFGGYFNPAAGPSIDYYSIALSTSRIGGIEYLGLDRSFKNFSLGIATSDSVWDRKSWLSFSSRIYDVSFGAGAGLDYEIKPILNAGMLYEGDLLSLGISYRYGTRKILQGGGSVHYDRVLFGMELEYAAYEDSSDVFPHLGVGYELTNVFFIQGGFYKGLSVGFSAAIGPLLINFGVDRIFNSDNESVKPHLGVYSIIQEKVIRKTITKIRVKKVPVEKKIYVPTKPKEKPKTEKKKKVPTKEELQYCDEHYRKGIEYYNQDKLEEAISEWKKVQNVCPDYLLVVEYLDKATKKLKLLKGIK